MSLVTMFKNSAKELKSLRCLTTTGILISIYVVMNAYVAFNTASLKITFGYLALAAIGMLYGPAVAAIAAIPCDLITAMLTGLGISFLYIPAKMTEGLIYGLLLYSIGSWNKENKVNQFIKIIISRLLVMTLCYMIYNTVINYYVMGVSKDSFSIYFAARLTKNLIQFPVDLCLMFILLPTIQLIYKSIRTFGERKRQ